MKKHLVFFGLMMFLGLQFAFAQTRQVSGTVTSSEDGLGIPGVSVVVKGTTIGVTTNLDGKYTLDVPQNATLVFSFVGMKPQELAVSADVINVVMEPETKEIEELVVTGYAVRAKNSITGSTVQVKADAIKDVTSSSVDQALQGKVAGLVISSSSGTPGSVQDIRIRGVGSLTASNDPLFVIDGVPVQNSDFSGSTATTTLSALSSLNNNDIESVTVLKDASATSAYGARGSNGVIVITTKKGKAGKTSYNFSAFYGFQNKAVEGPKVLTGAQREALYGDAVYNRYGVANGFTRDQAVEWGVINLEDTDLGGWIADGRPKYDWEKAYRNYNAPTQNYVFSASGGNEESSFYTSLGYNNTENIVVGSTFRRVNGALNFTKKFTDKIKFSTSNNVSNVLQDGLLLEQSAYFGSPLAGKYFTSTWFSPRYANGQPNTTIGGTYNWLYLKDHNVSYNDMTRGISNSYVEYEVVKNLKFKSLVGIDFVLNDYRNFYNRNYGDSQGENGTSAQSMDKNYNFVTQNSISYNFTYNDHNISAMALMEFQKNKEKYLYGYGANFAGDDLTNINSAASKKDADGTYYDWMNASYLGMINYSYLGKYIADFTYRREGSSRFGTGQRFGNFWSVGAAWNITQEQFMSSLSIINNLKLRTSYGVSGNSGIGINKYQELYAYDGNYNEQGASYPSTFGNPKLTWEKNHNFDVGLDFGILKNKISGSVSYFNKATSDLLQDVPLSRTSGFNSNTMNVGEMSNTGIEALLNVEIIKSKDFNANVSFNFATLKNEVTKLAKDGLGNNITIETGTRKTDVGHSINEWYMRKYAGVDPTNGLPQWYVNGKDDKDGITNNYYAANANWQGTSAIPKYTGGASLHVDYKGIYLDASVYFAGGHQVFEDWSFYTSHAGYYSFLLYQGVSTLMDRWQQPGDVTDVPKMYYDGTGYNASRTSTRFLYDGDYMRLKDLTIGYKLPKTLFSKIGFNGDLTVYARGANLLTWVKDDRLKYDPEVRADGFTRLTNPPLKSITFGLTLNF